MYFVYVLQSDQDKRFYTGLTQDLQKRIEEHNAGAPKATKARIPLKLVYYESCMNYKDATKRERYLKTTWGKRYIKNRIKNYLEENGKFT